MPKVQFIRHGQLRGERVRRGTVLELDRETALAYCSVGDAVPVPEESAVQAVAEPAEVRTDEPTAVEPVEATAEQPPKPQRKKKS